MGGGCRGGGSELKKLISWGVNRSRRESFGVRAFAEYPSPVLSDGLRERNLLLILGEG